MYPRHPWPAQFTRGELFRGWVFFALYLTVFPGVMGAVQQLTGSELPVAETNVLYYLLCAALLFLLLWTFLRQSFDRLWTGWLKIFWRRRWDWRPRRPFGFWWVSSPCRCKIPIP